MPWLTGDTPEPNKWYCRLTRIPYSLGFLQAVGGALGELTNPGNWQQFGTMTPQESAEMATELFYEWTRSDACMIGSVIPYATKTPPPNALACDGGTHNRVDFPVLYANLEAAYIVDSDTFRTPNLEGNFIFGADATHTATSQGGSLEHTLTDSELAPHVHTTVPHSHSDTPHSHTEGTALPAAADFGTGVPVPSAVPSVGVTGFATVGILPETVTVNSAGGGAPFSLLPPYTAMHYCIIAK